MAGLTDEEKQWLARTLGQSTGTSSSTPGVMPALPGSLPPGIPPGNPYISSGKIGNTRVTIPPPVAEVQRQISVEQEKARVRAAAKPIPSHQIDTMLQTQNASLMLDKIITSMEQNHYKTGPLSPRFYSGGPGNLAMQYRGTKEENSFKKDVANYQNVYSHVQTGANRGFKEIDWLNAAIPGASQDVPEKFLDAAYQARDNLTRNKEAMINLLKESGYNTERFGATTNSSAPTGGIRQLPAGVHLSPGAHVDKNGIRFNVNQDGTYQLQ